MARTGRPKIEIDPKVFENLCAIQCTKEEIAAFFSCSPDTIENFCKRQYNETFSAIFTSKRKIGDISLRRRINQSAEKSTAMQIFLAKNRLGMGDKPDETLLKKKEIELREREVVLKEKEHALLHEIAETAGEWGGLPAHLIGKAFVDIHRDIRERNYTTFDLKGGRGSLKSTFCAFTILDEMKHDPTACAVVLRAIKDDIKSTVYDQIVWAIDALNQTEEWKCTTSPIQITNRITGQVIYFRAADRPGKIKSIRPPKDKAIKIAWFEEFDEIKGMSAYRNVLQSVFRAGVDDGIVLRSYNTPISQAHFVNKDALVNDPKRIIHFSNYKDAPRQWLGETFFSLAEQLKETNERAYRHEYGGEATGTGANVFENVTVRKITDKEVETFDKIYGGIDWGYFPDPFAFNAYYYHKASQKLYIYGEVRGHKLSNKQSAEKLKSWKSLRIIADSAEPKSITDFKDDGFYIVGAKKGPGSVDYGMKWFASLSEIIIDPVRCPGAASEYKSYEYGRNKDGEIISEYPDAENHHIDNGRYALEDIWRAARGDGNIKAS